MSCVIQLTCILAFCPPPSCPEDVAKQMEKTLHTNTSVASKRSCRAIPDLPTLLSRASCPYLQSPGWQLHRVVVSTLTRRELVGVNRFRLAHRFMLCQQIRLAMVLWCANLDQHRSCSAEHKSDKTGLEVPQGLNLPGPRAVHV